MMEWWNDGMVEWWNNGILGFINGIYPGFDLCFYQLHLKKDFILLNPLFQSSNIPLFHVIGLRHSHFTLTRPKRPAFRCLYEIIAKVLSGSFR